MNTFTTLSQTELATFQLIIKCFRAKQSYRHLWCDKLRANCQQIVIVHLSSHHHLGLCQTVPALWRIRKTATHIVHIKACFVSQSKHHCREKRYCVSHLSWYIFNFSEYDFPVTPCKHEEKWMKD